MMDEVLLQITASASRYPLQKIILFGSRARGDYSETSDYDLALYGDGLTPSQKAQLALEIDETRTLHKIDIIWMNERIDEQMKANIAREGVVIYESART